MRTTDESPNCWDLNFPGCASPFATSLPNFCLVSDQGIKVHMTVNDSWPHSNPTY